MPPPPMIELVALDVDGTLLDPPASLPQARLDALAALGRARIRAILMTGKPWAEVRELVGRCDLDGPHVCCNGAAIMARDGRPLATATLAPDLVTLLSGELAERGLAQVLYLEDGAIITPDASRDFSALDAVAATRPQPGELGQRRALKVLAIVGNGDEHGVRQIATGGARPMRTGAAFLEWMPLETDKGTGLRAVAQRLGVGPERVAAVGDAESDLAAFAVAGLSVAVSSATEQVIAAADVALRGRDLASFLLELAD